MDSKNLNPSILPDLCLLWLRISVIGAKGSVIDVNDLIEIEFIHFDSLRIIKCFLLSAMAAFNSIATSVWCSGSDADDVSDTMWHLVRSGHAETPLIDKTNSLCLVGWNYWVPQPNLDGKTMEPALAKVPAEPYRFHRKREIPALKQFLEIVGKIMVQIVTCKRWRDSIIVLLAYYCLVLAMHIRSCHGGLRAWQPISQWRENECIQWQHQDWFKSIIFQ